MSTRTAFFALVLWSALEVTPRAPGAPFDSDVLTGITGADGLVLLDSVQKELKLTGEQTQKVKETVREVRQRRREDFDKLMKPEVGEEERRQKVLGLMKEVSRETTTKLANLLNPEQVRRMSQIELQARGLQAFSDPDVAQA